jgi:hypothetical protein
MAPSLLSHVLTLLLACGPDGKGALTDEGDGTGPSSDGGGGDDGGEGAAGGDAGEAPPPASTCTEGVAAIRGEQGYSTIQDAVDADLSEDESVWVCPGVHEEAVVILSSCRLLSLESSATTTLRAPSDRPAVEVKSGATEIRGLAIEGGSGCSWRGLNVGGGVCAPEAASLSLEDVQVRDNRADYGGGVFCPRSGPTTLIDSLVSGNVAEAGGGLYCKELSLIRSIVEGNHGEQGGGLICDGAGAQGVVQGDGESSVRGNTSGLGGGVFGQGCMLSFLRIEENSSNQCAGGQLSGRGSMDRVSLLNNTAEGVGGGMCFFESDRGCTMEVSDLVAEGNSGSYGGAATIQDCSATFQRSQLHSNTAIQQGGGLSIYRSEVSFTDGSIHSNSASAGGAVVLGDNDSSLHSEGTDWGEAGSAEDNSPNDLAVDGGAVVVQMDSEASCQGACD